MKKMLIGLAIMGLAGMAACSHDSKSDKCFVDDFEAGCINGKYVTCDVKNDGDTTGKRVKSEMVEISDIRYACNDDDELEPVLNCVNSVFAESHSDLIYTKDKILQCVGDRIIDITAQFRSLCMGNDRVYYDSGTERFRAQSCDSQNKVCEQIDKDGVISAICIEPANVESGCTDITAYGACEGDSLVICSNTDPAKGKTLHIDCKAVHNNDNYTCMLIDEESYGYDCALTCGDYAGDVVTDFGFCDTNHLHYCSQSGEYYETDCGTSTCAFNGIYYDCI